MLSHHEIPTLLLVQRSPAEVKALGLGRGDFSSPTQDRHKLAIATVRGLSLSRLRRVWRQGSSRTLQMYEAWYAIQAS
jgi:hypothetical protein